MVVEPGNALPFNEARGLFSMRRAPCSGVGWAAAIGHTRQNDERKKSRVIRSSCRSAVIVRVAHPVR